MIPQLAVGLSALYSVGKAYDGVRFWNDYYKNTGIRPRYPFRAGYFDPMRDAANVGFSYHFLKRL